MKYFKLILVSFFASYFISLRLPVEANSFPDQPMVKRLLELPLEQLQEIMVVTATGRKQPMIKAPAVVRPPVAVYSTVDLTLRYHHDKRPWEVGLSIRNLFDAEAREPTDAVILYDLPLAGRNFWLELGYQF